MRYTESTIRGNTVLDINSINDSTLNLIMSDGTCILYLNLSAHHLWDFINEHYRKIQNPADESTARRVREATAARTVTLINQQKEWNKIQQEED